jgi:GDP-L-fucose synthase
LIRKFIEAKVQNKSSVEIWGSGKPLREFLHVDDLAEACLFLMQKYSDIGFVNVGSGAELTIADLAKLIGKLVGYNGQLTFNTSRPDGTPRKLMDVSKLASMGWKYSITLEQGLKHVIETEFSKLQTTTAK